MFGTDWKKLGQVQQKQWEELVEEFGTRFQAADFNQHEMVVSQDWMDSARAWLRNAPPCRYTDMLQKQVNIVQNDGVQVMP